MIASAGSTAAQAAAAAASTAASTAAARIPAAAASTTSSAAAAAAASSICCSSTLHLSRELLRAAKSFKNANFRDYFVRRTKEKIRELSINKNKINIEEIMKKELNDLKRQAIISNIYHKPTITIYK